jgi:hypothetical protein
VDVTHREFKVLLSGDLFSQRAALHQMQEILLDAAKGQAGTYMDRVPTVTSYVRGVQFYDTPDEHLRASHRILRLRRPQFDGWQEESSEFTYKVRSEDRAAAEGRQLITSIDGRKRAQLKEEIVPGEQPGIPTSLWSHNLVIEARPDALPTRGKTVLIALPDLRDAGITDEHELAPVGGMEVIEVGSLLGHLFFGHDVTAHADVAIWRAELLGDAFVAEVGFTYHTLADQKASAHKRADDYFLSLEEALRGWRSSYRTKTQAVYEQGKLNAK